MVSNYVYHNIPGNRQDYLLETLRTLKKGGAFALHDIFSKSKYGDMQAFVQKLRDMGYQKVALIDTTDGTFMTPFEARWMALSGSALLIGIKAIEERKEMINAKKAMDLLEETKEELTKGTTKGSPVEGIISAVTGIMISKVGLMMQGKI